MKIVLKLISGEILSVNQNEVEQFTIAESKRDRFFDLPRLKRKIAVNQVTEIKEIKQKSCTKCGDTYYEDEQHFCSYKGLDDVLQSGQDSENLKKLREQVDLMSAGMYSNEHHKRIWGHDIPSSDLSIAEREDIKKGIAKICYDKNGKRYCGYLVDRVVSDAKSKSSVDALASKDMELWYQQ